MKHFLIILILFSVGCAKEALNESDGRDGRDGKDGVNGAQGVKGSTGAAGTNGKDGKDGKSCSVAQNSIGVLISCPDGTHALITVPKCQHVCKHKKHHH